MVILRVIGLLSLLLQSQEPSCSAASGKLRSKVSQGPIVEVGALVHEAFETFSLRGAASRNAIGTSRSVRARCWSCVAAPWPSVCVLHDMRRRALGHEESMRDDGEE